MNKVEINDAEIPPPIRLSSLKRFVRYALRRLGKRGWTVSLLFCSDNEIQRLNSDYRSTDRATDVLSFAQSNVPTPRRRNRIAGDIVISTDTLRRTVSDRNVPIQRELRRLIVHGLLHLDGMDHDETDEHDPMLKLQDDVLARSRLKG